MKCTPEFTTWINSLDRSLRIRVDQRLTRLDDGNPGLHRRFDGLLEVKWRTGAMGSFRVYCAEMDEVLLLLGGHKDTQSKDIDRAKELLKGVKDGEVKIEHYE